MYAKFGQNPCENTRATYSQNRYILTQIGDTKWFFGGFFDLMKLNFRTFWYTSSLITSLPAKSISCVCNNKKRFIIWLKAVYFQKNTLKSWFFCIISQTTWDIFPKFCIQVYIQHLYVQTKFYYSTPTTGGLNDILNFV